MNQPDGHALALQRWIRRVSVTRFKRYGQETVFDLPGHMALAGPNNSGKTTLLQAIAAWHFAAHYWLQKVDDHNPRNGYVKAPVARQGLATLPLRSLEMLWTDRSLNSPAIITVELANGRKLGMEFIANTSEQLFLRPTTPSLAPEGAWLPDIVFVPPMTGLAVDEPVYTLPKIQQLLSLNRPGEVLRNVLVQANHDEPAWRTLTDTIRRLFGYELLPPNDRGADIIAEYSKHAGGPAFDIATAGSGFQQVLMLVSFLATRSGSVLLVDEPDAHLHVILQHSIYQELKRIAAKRGSQIIIATHSEVILDTVDPTEICVLLDQPRPLTSKAERLRLRDALRMVRNVDLMLVRQAPGILYLEGSTDLAILKAWARVLSHPAQSLFDSPHFLWRPVMWEVDETAPGSRARDHFEALKLAQPQLRALEMIDGDSLGDQAPTIITGEGYQKVRWRRYEIESYLFHPAALIRFAENMVGADGARAMDVYLRDSQPPAWFRDPLGEHAFLTGTKARTELIPPALTAAGVLELSYTRFDEIAALMLKEEIHPEVVEKLDAICDALRWPRDPEPLA
jgi:hypothetical protein